MTAAYDAYQLHRAFRLLHDFCSVQISAVYGNAMKDRLYCELPASPAAAALPDGDAPDGAGADQAAGADDRLHRRRGVGVHHRTSRAEEADCRSVHLALLPEPSGETASHEQQREWKLLMDLRDAGAGPARRAEERGGAEQGVGCGGGLPRRRRRAARRGCRRTAPTWKTWSAPGFHSFGEAAPGSEPSVDGDRPPPGVPGLRPELEAPARRRQRPPPPRPLRPRRRRAVRRRGFTLSSEGSPERAKVPLSRRGSP